MAGEEVDDSSMTPAMAEGYRRFLSKHPDAPRVKIRANPALEQYKIDGQYAEDGVIELNPRIMDPAYFERLLLHEIEHSRGGDEPMATAAERPRAMPAQVGERRRFGDQIAEWDGDGWVPVEVQEPQASDLEQVGSRVWDQASMIPGVGPALNAIDIARGEMTPEEYAKRRGIDALVVGSTAVGGPLLRAAGRGVGAAAGYAVENTVLGGAVKEGVRAALRVPKGTKVLPWLTAKIGHALKRESTVAPKAASKAVEATTEAAKRARATDATKTAELPDAWKAKVAPKGKAVTTRVNPSGKLPSGEEMGEEVKGLLESNLSRGQAAQTLKERYGVTVYTARKIVDMVADAYKIQ